MEFLKNIKGKFNLNPDCKVLKHVDGVNNSHAQCPMTLKVNSINLNSIGKEIEFKVVSVDDIDILIDTIISGLTNRITKETNKAIRITKLIIKEWTENPSNFKKNKGGYNSDPYHNSKIKFGNLKDWIFPSAKYSRLSIRIPFDNGHESNTFKSLEDNQTILTKLTTKLDKELTKLNSDVIRTRIGNYIMSEEIKLSVSDVIKYVTVSNDSTKIKKRKLKKCPISFSGDELNAMLRETGGLMEIDNEFINYLLEETGVDITKLMDWTINSGTNGFHNNDGQLCDYWVTFDSPDGDTYRLTNKHCLVTGWNFHGEKITPE